MTKNFSQTGLPWLWVSLLVFALDQITKLIALKTLTAYVPLSVLPFLNFMLAFNRGAAFSFLHSASGWQVWLFGGIALTISVVIIIWLWRLSYKQAWLCIALALVVGGALGNLWDRLYLGHVVDFIQLYYSTWYWPAFNVADSAICVGAVMLFLDLIRKPQSE